MSQNLLIVESPSKAKTLQKYLGRGFDIVASYGHVRDLEAKEGAVDSASGLEVLLLKGPYGFYAQLGQTPQDKTTKPKRAP